MCDSYQKQSEIVKDLIPNEIQWAVILFFPRQLSTIIMIQSSNPTQYFYLINLLSPNIVREGGVFPPSIPDITSNFQQAVDK